MKNKFRYIEQKKRKKIFLLCDDIRMNSGIGTMAKEIVLGTAHHFNWIQLGAAMKHPEEGKAFDLSENVNKEVGIEDAYVRIVPSTGYGNAKKVRDIMKVEKPDALFIFTDPRYWDWLFEIEREIRTQVPIFWLNIWDDYPAPLYNKPFYESVDVLMAISKQTKTINELVLEEKAEDKIINFIPHGINTKHFFPIKEGHENYDKLLEFKKKVLKDKEYEFVLFFNSRNIARKHPADTILAYRQFCDMIGKEKAEKCAFILHTEPIDKNGTDLKAVREAFCDSNYNNVFFSTGKLETAQMNLLYNICDATILMSSNEGWGLALTESLMTGTPIIATVTGGMQDQMRFVDKKGKWFTPSADVPSNHRGTYKEHGEWAVPVFPSNLSIQGSPTTPYIFDDRASIDDTADAIFKMYSYGDEERIKRGEKGRKWVNSEEAGMTAEKMCQNVIETLDEAFERFTPRNSFNMHKITDIPARYIKHKLTGY